MLSEVIAGTLVEVISATGRWLAVQAATPRGRRYKEDASIAEWFDTYKLSNSNPPTVALPPSISEEALATILRSNEIQASLHELLAARLTDAPEADIDRVHTTFAYGLAHQASTPISDQAVDDLFQYYDVEICSLVGRLQGAQPNLFIRIRTDAFSSRIIAVLNAIEAHTAILATDPDPVAEERFLSSYYRHVRDLHGRLQPPDFERRQRIPIDDLYVSPKIVKMDPSTLHTSGPHTVVDQAHAIDSDPSHALLKVINLSALAESIDRTVLLGDPGGGKSTASSVLMHNYASKSGGPIPFLVVLRDFASESPPNRSVVDYIEHKLRTLYQCSVPADLVSRILLSGRGLVIFDGLDELIDTSHRIEVTEIVEQFCMEYPLTPVLVTSRLIGYDQARLDETQFICYRLGGFNEDQTEEYVRKWFKQDAELDPGQVTVWTRSFMEESASVPDLRSNPLMLALMCVLYHGEGSIPHNRPEVYEQCSELLLRKWDAWRRISVDLRAARLIQPALRHLAYWVFTRDNAQPTVSERQLIQQTTAFLTERGFETEEEATEAAQQFIEFCRGRAWVFSDTGTTATGERLYTFTHRTFLEYFVGAYLAIASDTPEALAQVILPHAAKEEWEIVAELAIQKKGQTNDRGAERVVLAMLSERRRRSIRGRTNVLCFLVRCLASIEMSPQITRDVSRAILAHFMAGFSDDPDRYTPVTNLLFLPKNQLDLVRDEILNWASSVTKTADVDSQLKALLLVCNLETGLMTNNAMATPTLGSNAFGYWEQVTDEARGHYSELIARYSEASPSVLRLAEHEGIVNTAQILARNPNAFTELFEPAPVGVFVSSWAGRWQWCVHEFLNAENNTDCALAINDFSAIGEFLSSNPTLPWCKSRNIDRLTFTRDAFVRASPRIDSLSQENPMAYLGLLVVVAIMCELMVDNAADNAEATNHNFRDFFSYIEKRRSKSSQKLRPLTVAEPFRTLFLRWADGLIDFGVRDISHGATTAPPE